MVSVLMSAVLIANGAVRQIAIFTACRRCACTGLAGSREGSARLGVTSHRPPARVDWSEVVPLQRLLQVSALLLEGGRARRCVRTEKVLRPATHGRRCGGPAAGRQTVARRHHRQVAGHHPGASQLLTGCGDRTDSSIAEAACAHRR